MDIFNKQEYQPRDIKESEYGIEQMSKGYAKGYHEGLKEGFIKAKRPEICHCPICHSHGEMCKIIHSAI